MLLVRGPIHTNDPSRRTVQALLAGGGLVRALGDDAILAAPAGVDVLEIAGAAVPGLVDSHAHLLGLGEALSSVDLTGAGSFAEVVQRAVRAARKLPPGAWLTGRGWDQEAWPGGALPEHGPISLAIGDRPVALTRVDGHALVANAVALAAAGVSKSTAEPAGGRIVRGPGGEPTGVLVDGAMGLVLDRIPRPDAATRRAWLGTAFARCLELGLTQVHDAGADPATLELYRELDSSGVLPIRVYAMVDAAAPGALEERARGPMRWAGRGMLAIGAVKIYADGALGSRGALMFDDYADAPGERGLAVTSLEQVASWAGSWARAGFQLAVHVIGDRANAEVLDLLETLAVELGAEKVRRPRLEHAQVLRRADIARAAAMGAVASMQPVHAVSDLAWLHKRLWPRQLEGAYAWRSFLEAGARLALGSDFPVESPDPLLGLRAAVEREGTRLPPPGWRSDERLSLDAALRGFTEGAAWASFAEGRRGRLAPGMDADLTVLDVDPFSAPDALGRARVVATVVGGHLQWRR